ncbi:zinc-binding dehydrogenase [Arthrobacter sp. Leaf141]|uniref:zinc-binding dehydrogenase n=1 Tax=Arthrobacter sp. Leaf141 TaxID=1736273 RepID=UPI003FA493AC
MSTHCRSVRVVPPSYCLGFLMFLPVPSVFRDWNAVRVPPRTTNPRDGFAEAAALSGFSLNIEHQYTLNEAAAAHRAAESGHTVGKLIVIP